MSILWVAIGGFFGSITRYYCSLLWRQPGVNTWIVNVGGSILLGIFVYLYTHDQLSATLFSLLGVGFCGAFTTFSTFGYECASFIMQKRYTTALFYVSSMVIVSLSIVYIIVSFL